MKSRRRTIIGMHTDCVRVIVVRSGAIVTQSCAWLTERAPHDAWDDGLRAYDEPLRRALQDAGVKAPCNVEVIYEAPTTAIGPSAARTKGKGGTRAALLELETRGAVDLSTQPHAAWVVGTSDSGESLAIAVTDSPLTLNTLSRWVERSELTMTSGVPTEAIGVAGALALHAMSREQGPRITAYLGGWCSGVVVASDEGVRFVRSSPLTTDALASAMAAIPAGNSTLGPDLARDMLLSSGLPDTSNAPGASGINAHEARAAIQPLLQRAAVDLRQSLRFGLDKNDMDRVMIYSAGESTNIDGLVPLVAELLGVERCNNGACQEVPILMAALDRLALIPTERRERVKASRLQKALWAGAAAALGVSVAQGLIAMDEGAKAERSLISLRSGATGLEQIDARKAEVEARERLVNNVNRAVMRTAEFGPRWPGWLVDLAERCPERVIVLGMSGSRTEDDAGTIALNGVVLPADFMTRLADPDAHVEGVQTPDGDQKTPDDQTAVLRSFIASLEESPLVEKVDLGSTRRGTAMGEGSTSFALSIRLLSAPALAEVDHD